MVDFTKSNRWKTFNDQMMTPIEKKIVSYFELLERQLIVLEAAVHKIELAMKAETKDAEANNVSIPTVANVWNPGDRFYSDLYEGYGTVVSFVHAYDELPSSVWVQFDRDKDECGKFSIVPSDKIRKLTLEEELKEKA